MSSAATRELRVVRLGEPDYPPLLAASPDPPEVLYVRGRLEAAEGLAIVGSRRPTPYGRRMARRLALAAAGTPTAGGRLSVVSGLARGIDSEAHRAALEAGGLTCAVLGSGLDRVYPPENERLAEELVEAGGCLLSELPPGAPPLPGHFPRRDRIIAGLAWAAVVVEGREGSGALITARCALEAGREVLAVPGPADSELSAAPHRLLREGAAPACSMADVWPLLPPACRPVGGPCRPAVPYSKTSAGVAAAASDILDWLGSDVRTIEEILQKTGLDFSALSNILLDMELNDLIEALPGQRYAKKGH